MRRCAVTARQSAIFRLVRNAQGLSIVDRSGPAASADGASLVHPTQEIVVRYLIRRTATVLLAVATLTVAATPAMADTERCVFLNDWTIICVDI